MSDLDTAEKRDWAGNICSFLITWGLPIIVLVGATALDGPKKAVAWTAALVWMGSACIANVSRCGRTHCYFTGPFFLLMTIPVLLHGFDIWSFGPSGWRWLGIAIGVGGGGLWCLTEKFWGKYLARENKVE